MCFKKSAQKVLGPTNEEVNGWEDKKSTTFWWEKTVGPRWGIT
jgi:hypothetical protein